MQNRKVLTFILFLVSSLLLTASPAAAITVEISGNGSGSDNTANVSVSSTTQIFQSNTADVANSVNANANTGNNAATDNTGGDVTINTGYASANLSVNNELNKNLVSLNCCPPMEAEVKVSGNGADSDNEVNLSLSSNVNIVDQKWLKIKNRFNVDANTGGNDVRGNTGGNVWINTGNANIGVQIDNRGNINKIILGAMLPDVPKEEKPPVEEEKPGPGGLPSPGAVLAAAKQLPITGFDYRVILAVCLGLIGLGLMLRRNSLQVEVAVNRLGRGLNRIRTGV